MTVPEPPSDDLVVAVSQRIPPDADVVTPTVDSDTLTVEWQQGDIEGRITLAREGMSDEDAQAIAAALQKGPT
jgi:hypothetical protein